MQKNSFNLTCDKRTLAFLLKKNANQFPARTAYIYLDDKLCISAQITYHDLLNQAQQLSLQIKKIASSKEIIPIVFTPRIEFIVTLFAVILSGRKAVCLNLPNYIFLAKYADRIKNIFNLIEPKIALYTKKDQSLLDPLLHTCPELVKTTWVDIDELLKKVDLDTVPGVASDNSLYSNLTSQQEVLLQFTSGTTNKPKGIALTHEQILSNLSSIVKSTKLKKSTKLVSWLPHSHDMGLIGGLFVPFYLGGTSIQIKTQDYLKNPLNWLMAISQFRAEATAAPNFAYEQVTRANKIPLNLDLSSLKVAFNGSETIQPETVEQFTKKFKNHHFKNSALFNCYGLAEATLFVTGKFYQNKKDFIFLDRKALLKDKIKISKNKINSVGVINCGRITYDTQIKILSSKDCIGEVLISGRSVIKKYWSNARDNNKNFKTIKIKSLKTQFLKTNDLGFIYKKHLYILGRKDDVIIVNAEKIHTQDIAQVICPVSKNIIKNGILLFKNKNVLNMLIEIRQKKEVATEIKNKISEILFLKFLIRPKLILCKPGSLVRTTSGKLNKSKSIEKYKNLEII